ncbi:MAG: RpiB/LacA/LacB family sugar-phosphate isomerase [Lentisphaeria bacterium]|nr:MAG: RpiB/LacA/LacB family sugar-phosphate isomerase [Lentisphaeria bacterium]
MIDCGPFSFDAADDYSDFGAPVARAIARGEAECGILICRSGVGMGILANRVHGVRAVVADNPELAKKKPEPQLLERAGSARRHSRFLRNEAGHRELVRHAVQRRRAACPPPDQTRNQYL